MNRDGIFAGDDPFALTKAWLAEAEVSEPNDPNAIALSTVDAEGLPNVRIVLLKEIEADGFVFYTNYESQKGGELITSGKAAFVMHWKSLRRQVRVRGLVSKVPDAQSDAYYASRDLQSRLGAWASQQSRPLSSRASLIADVAKQGVRHGTTPPRPPHWGGFKIVPLALEFWADGAHRLHDRFRWERASVTESWNINRLHP